MRTGIQLSITRFTNAQIKALPTTPVSLNMPTPAAGHWIRILGVTYAVNTAAGAYTNINAVYADFSIKAGADTVHYGPINDNTGTVPLSYLSSLLGVASRKISHQPVPNLSAAPDAAALEYVLNQILNDYATVQGVLPELTMDNNGSGNLTGGDAANTMVANVLYLEEALP